MVWPCTLRGNSECESFHDDFVALNSLEQGLAHHWEAFSHLELISHFLDRALLVVLNLCSFSDRVISHSFSSFPRENILLLFRPLLPDTTALDLAVFRVRWLYRDLGLTLPPGCNEREYVLA